MRNVTGAPVEGDDYFERPDELRRLLDELDNRSSIRMNAPRRVGKTSLVLRLCREWRDVRHNPAVFINVEGTEDELSFSLRLLEKLGEAGLQPDAVSKIQLSIEKVRQTLGLTKVETGVGIDLVLENDGKGISLGRAIESVFRQIELGDNPVLVAIDELPETLLALSKRPEGGHRVSKLLHWLRNLRQTYRNKIRWVFLGSIGMDGFVEERLLGKTINDLTSFSLGALSEAEALRFLERLASDNGITIGTEEGEAIISRVGWPLPYHLQVFVHALRSLETKHVDTDAIDRAWEHLLSPENLSQFDTWRQKLVDQLSETEARQAKWILNELCQEADGRTREQLQMALMAKQPSADPEAVGEQLAALLLSLQRDGYLLRHDDRYSFRSFLLREYWYRRFIL